MKKYKLCRVMRGTYSPRPRILKFGGVESLMDEDDIERLFMGLFRLLKSNVRASLKREYQKEIMYLKRELEVYKSKGY